MRWLFHRLDKIGLFRASLFNGPLGISTNGTLLRLCHDLQAQNLLLISRNVSERALLRICLHTELFGTKVSIDYISSQVPLLNDAVATKRPRNVYAQVVQDDIFQRNLLRQVLRSLFCCRCLRVADVLAAAGASILAMPGKEKFTHAHISIMLSLTRI